MELIEGVDYYREEDLLVFTSEYHRKRGECCGSGCRHCPYEPRWSVGATTLGAPNLQQQTRSENSM